MAARARNGTVIAAAGNHPQLQEPPLQHDSCSTPGAGLLPESVASMCPAQCSMAGMAEPCAWVICADIRAHAIGTLTRLSVTARSARKSLDLRPDIQWARSGAKACAVAFRRSSPSKDIPSRANEDKGGPVLDMGSPQLDRLPDVTLSRCIVIIPIIGSGWESRGVLLRRGFAAATSDRPQG